MQGDPFVLILGMHRSGTSCLAGALEACGLWLGEVGRSDKWNAKGNREHDPARLLNDRILEEGGGSWFAPPATITVTPAQRAAMAAIVRELAARSPAGLKEPRVPLVLDAWRAAIGSPQLVGTYRHPGAVAASLAHRNQLPAAQAYALWRRYNEPIVAAHRASPFPIVAFDLTDPARYCATVARVAIALGLDLQPDLDRLRAFVSAELDHGREADATLPPDCRELWDYLESVREPWAVPQAVTPARISARDSAPHAASASPPRPRLHFVCGPTCAGKSLYLARHVEPGATVLLLDRGARAAIAGGGTFLIHYNLLRPFDKFAAVAGVPLAERFRRTWRRLRGRVAGPFAVDRRLQELLAATPDVEATVLVAPQRLLVERIAARRAVEPADGDGDVAAARRAAMTATVDLPKLYRLWLAFLRARGIPFRLLDARTPEFRPLRDEAALDRVLAG
ncbi:MAG: hypothetical protein EXS13_14845 [Planctomycetes bacterium]|nr:hypothetical protein [Planctomycetota bacterium]